MLNRGTMTALSKTKLSAGAKALDEALGVSLMSAKEKREVVQAVYDAVRPRGPAPAAAPAPVAASDDVLEDLRNVRQWIHDVVPIGTQSTLAKLKRIDRAIAALAAAPPAQAAAPIVQLGDETAAARVRALLEKNAIYMGRAFINELLAATVSAPIVQPVADERGDITEIDKVIAEAELSGQMNWEPIQRALVAPTAPKEKPCREDGRCQYAIDHGAEGMAHCSPKCVMPADAEQARFEAWAGTGGGFDISKRDDGLFESEDTYNAWVGWKNRPALTSGTADAKDAARYRFLRNNCNVGLDQSQEVQMVIARRPAVTPPKRWSDSPNAKFRVEIRAAIDALVDTAITSSAGEVKP